MLFLEMPLKAKFVGIVVLAVLTFSLVGATLEAVKQVFQEGPSGSPAVAGQSAGSAENSTGSGEDNVAIVTLKFICPFH
jgi:hypothetical protein